MNECKCLNNGQCLLNNVTSNYSCFCNGCTGGEFCENVYYYIQYTMVSSISIHIQLEESPLNRRVLKIVFIFVFSLLTVISSISNFLTILTCFIRKIRITVCGLYMIVYSISSFLALIFLEMIAVATLLYNNELNKYPQLYCSILPALLYLALNINLWLSAFIAVERVLIQFEYLSIYRTRKYSLIVLIILFIFRITASVISALGRGVGKSPILTTSYVCLFNYFPNDNLSTVYKVVCSVYLDTVIPLLLIFLSVVLTLAHIIRRKIILIGLEEISWQLLIKQQISRHKDFFIPPLVIIVCTLPDKTLISIADSYCIEKGMQKFYLRLHIALDLILHSPLIFTFFIYIYPSNVYRKLFQQIEIIKWIKIKQIFNRFSRNSNMVEEVNNENIVEETNM